MSRDEVEGPVEQTIAYVALVVRDCDEAIAFRDLYANRWQRRRPE